MIVTFTNPSGGTNQITLVPYGAFTGAITTTYGTNAAGTQVIITAPAAGSGGGPDTKAFASNGSFVYQIVPFDPNFTGGESITAGTLSGGGFLLAIGAGAGGGPDLKVYNGSTGLHVEHVCLRPEFHRWYHRDVGPASGRRHKPIDRGGRTWRRTGGRGLQFRHRHVVDRFFAYANSPPTNIFTGGVTVAAGNVLGKGHDEIITGTGPGGGSQVSVIDLTEASNGTFGVQQVDTFFAYQNPTTNTDEYNGVRVGTQALNGSSILSILTAQGPGGSDQVNSYTSLLQAPFDTAFAFNPTSGMLAQTPFA